MYGCLFLMLFFLIFAKVQCDFMNALLFGCYQYNFVGRLLGPRGNSLKRVEATTQCRVYIRGRGSVKDSVKVTSQLLAYIRPHYFVFSS
jgi:hypothetical protein